MAVTKRDKTFRFLQGDGEMSTLIREHEWINTSIGTPAEWPQSLKAAVGILLHTKFPAFLFWGTSHICFYNDAYRPSLGVNGKHPKALGAPGIEVFPEIWKDIKPLIDNVFDGSEAIMNNDLLLPIYRNGSLEDVYWSFCYSPAFADDDQVGGVFIICQETTEKINSFRQLNENNARLQLAVTSMEESEERFHQMAEATDILIAIGDETSNAIYFNKAWAKLTGRSVDDLLEFGWVDRVHPDDKEKYVDIYLSAFKQQLPFIGEFRVLNEKNEYRWLISTGNPRYRSDNSFAGYISNCIDITVSKEQQEKVLASEQRFRSLIQSAPAAIAIFTGRELIVEEPNEAFIIMSGKTSAITGLPLRQAMPELQGQPFLQILDDVFTSGKKFETFGTQVQVNNNGIITNNYYDFSYTPLFNENHSVYAILEIAIDVTSKIVALQATERSEANLLNIITQSPAAMCILKGPRHTVEIANERMLALWGVAAEKVMHIPVFEGLPEASGQGLEELLDRVYRTGKSFHGYEVPVNLPRHGHIEIVYVNFVYEALREAEGHISGIMVVGNDVTEQVLARKQTEQSKAGLQNITDRLQLAIDAGELGLFEIDLNTKEIDASARFKQIFEKKDSRLTYDYIAMIHPDDLPLRELAMARSLETGSFEYSVRLVMNSGFVKWVMIKGKVVYDASGQPLKMMGIAQDISNAKELESQKDSFLAIASHELKTPITSIKAYAQIMQMMMEKAGELKYADMVRRIDRQVNNLNALIADLLDVTKINSGRLIMTTTSFDFRQLVEEVIEDMQRISPKHRIHTAMQFSGNILADRQRINQVITNLVSNAIKYSPNADRINVFTKQENDEITLCVEDFGIGIPESKQARVFEQFYRVSGAKEHTFPGLGLGLYISSEIIKRMGGRIWVNSVPGKGSTFCFSFPLHNEDRV